MHGFKVGDIIRFVDDGDLRTDLVGCHGMVVSLFGDTSEGDCFGEVKVLDGVSKGSKVETYVQHAELGDDNL